MAENIKNEEWISGDGGPLVVIQTGAVPRWCGAIDFEQSIMNGGTLETDYDVVGDCRDYHIHRHSRDMLVLNDCEWSGRIFSLDNGVVVVEQPYYTSDEFPDVIQQIASSRPSESFPINIVDNHLRLLVGADGGNGENYGFSEVEISTGPKRCDVYHFKNVLAITINPA